MLPGGRVVGVDCTNIEGRVAAHVIRQVKEGKDDQHCAQKPSLLVVRVGAAGPVAQLPDAVQTAVTDGEQREEEADGGAKGGIWEALLGVTQKYVQGTDSTVAPRASLDKTHSCNRYAEDQCGQPDRHTQQAGLSLAQQHQRA